MRTVISAMSLMSPAGIGTGPFRAAIDAALLAGGPQPLGEAPGGRVEDFRPEESASARPVRLADRPSAMAIATVEALLPDDVLAAWPPDRRALVLGSGASGIDQSMTLTRDSLTRPRPDNITPALVPACVMNYASAQAAIRFDLRGPNATVTAGRATGLAALRYARRLLTRGRADAVVCGAYEDLNDRRAAIAEAAGIKAPPAEGCCAFLVEPGTRARAHGRPELAEVLALESGVFAEPADAGAVLAGTVRRALDRAGADPGDVALLVPSGDEDAGLGALRDARVLRTADLVGDLHGAAAAFQVATAIAVADEAPLRGLALITAVDPDGQAGCCLLHTR
ncbi:3-oxoacyl-ACP synthase [Actinomadura darangshiensis]|uniref:3-oxoacyl-ACP synthase n=1 Tax=Actinomadura darangshiensis TaxID=705336 RepID=A0A4R5BP24_9ACTN|nr:beta-ketoacyl synthase N-terminal-like domain-containing protein [Actinomadura darangshiensis]TDD87649.1 3-oxoacyl-ACP synthase [Actinomadura darangshiensis]